MNKSYYNTIPAHHDINFAPAQLANCPTLLENDAVA